MASRAPTFDDPDINTKGMGQMALRDAIDTFVETFLDDYQQAALQIHATPETSNHEFFARETLVALLEQQGFAVRQEVAGHRTAFDARYTSAKPGPVIVFLAEYDALPDIGHACGHNLFGTTSSLAASALRHVIDEIGGEVRVYGTPGEEGGEHGWAKDSFVKAGFFDDVDAALCAHPGYRHTRTSPSLAVDMVDVQFVGKAAHAAARPEAGINALDAVIQVFNGVNAWRQQLPPGARVHGIITDGGAAPNIIPEHASAKFFLRAETRPVLNAMTERFRNIVQGAALATGASAFFDKYDNKLDNTLIIREFDDVYARNLALYGQTLEEKPVNEGYGSSDVGNVSQLVPTIQPMISISDTPIVLHSLDSREAAKSRKGLDSIGLGARVLALTAIELIQTPSLLTSITAAHRHVLEAQQAK